MLEDGTHTLRIQIYAKNLLFRLYSYFGLGCFDHQPYYREGLDSHQYIVISSHVKASHCTGWDYHHKTSCSHPKPIVKKPPCRKSQIRHRRTTSKVIKTKSTSNQDVTGSIRTQRIIWLPRCDATIVHVWVYFHTPFWYHICCCHLQNSKQNSLTVTIGYKPIPA